MATCDYFSKTRHLVEAFIPALIPSSPITSTHYVVSDALRRGRVAPDEGGTLHISALCHGAAALFAGMETQQNFLTGSFPCANVLSL